MRRHRRAGGRGGGRGGSTGGDARAIAHTAERFKLQEVRLSGYRCYVATNRVVLGNDGLACITGPNGSGKSTLLNAILFGLGEHATQLGARQNAELASAAYAEVELLFRGVSRGVSDVKVSSSVSRADGVRTYAVNGQKLPKHRFDHFLRTRLGIATGNPFWRVSQDGIHRLLHASPTALHDTLCEVSGTKAINAHRSTAVKQLARWERSLADIQRNLAALEEAVGREGAHLLAMDRVRELTAELDAIPAEMEALDGEIARAEHLAAERLLDRLRTDVEALETEKRDAEERVRDLQAKKVAELGGGEGGETDGGGAADDVDRSCTGGGGEVEVLQRELSLTLTELAKVSTEVKLGQAALREKKELDAKWGEILLAAKSERADLDARSAALRGRGAVVRERMARLQDEVDRSHAQLFAATAGNGSPSGGSGSGDATRRALDGHEASVKRAETRWSAASASVSRAEAEVEEHGAQAASAKAAVDEVWERMRQIGSPLHAADDAENYLRGIKDQRRLQRERQLDLSRSVESSRQSLAAAARRMGAPQWCSQLAVANSTSGGGGGGGGGNGHRGFLFELFEIQPADPRERTTVSTLSQALASLLAGSLSVWVCDSSKHADQALDLAKANSAGLRVWPIDRLRAASQARRGVGRSDRVRQALEWAERQWPGQVKVTDPASLLAWDEGDEGVTAAVEKALGAWLITTDDETSAVVLKELGLSSVTVSGVRHAPGEVVGGEGQGEGVRLAAKRDWDVANRARKQGETSLEACAEGCRDLTRRLEAGAEFARLQVQRAVLKKEARECAERLSESERKAAGARQKLDWANEEHLRLRQQSVPLGEDPGKDADPEDVLATLKRALDGREEALQTTKAVSEQLNKEIGSLAEASMEALERENNAREVLGMNVGNGSSGSSSGSNSKNNTGDDDDDDNQQENEQAGRGGEDADADEEETAASAAVSDRLVAMKHAVEIKISRAAELERSRDELVARVGEATLREKGAGERLSALEEEMADVNSAVAHIGGRLKAKRKGVKEAERRARHATSKVRLLGEGGRAQAGDSYSPGAGSSKPPTAGAARPAAAKATPTTAAGDVGVWEDEGSGSGNNNGKENVPKNLPAKLSDEELLAKKHELAAKEKLLSSELRSLRRRSDDQQTHAASGSGSGSGRRGRVGGGAASQAAVVAGSVDEVTVRKRRAKIGVLKHQLASVLEGARQLEAGVKACEGRMHEANEAAYNSVRGELRTLFGAICVNKSADLVMVGPKLEDGLRLVVRNENTQASAAAAAAAAAACGTTAAAALPPAAVVERSPQELSGGQQALLGLAMVLALSSYQSPPLCLMDEVDAALDETNQAAAARLVAMTFRDGQALCVSHHAEFHRQSGHCVAVEMRDGVSRVRQT